MPDTTDKLDAARKLVGVTVECEGMNMSIADKIQTSLMGKSKEELIAMYQAQVRYHNQFCARANEWRVAMTALCDAVRPIAHHLGQLESDAHEALQVGGYIPVEEGGESTVPNKLLFDARKAIQRTPAEHTHKFSEAMRGARLAIAALKEIAGGGCFPARKIAADALAEVKKIDPYA